MKLLIICFLFPFVDICVNEVIHIIANVVYICLDITQGITDISEKLVYFVIVDRFVKRFSDAG